MPSIGVLEVLKFPLPMGISSPHLQPPAPPAVRSAAHRNPFEANQKKRKKRYPPVNDHIAGWNIHPCLMGSIHRRLNPGPFSSQSDPEVFEGGCCAMHSPHHTLKDVEKPNQPMLLGFHCETPFKNRLIFGLRSKKNIRSNLHTYPS